MQRVYQQERELVMPLCWVLTQVHLKHWGHFGVPQHYTAAAKLERAQGRATTIFRGWRLVI